VSCFDSFFIAQPDLLVLEKFQAVVSPIFHNIHALSQKNANLRRTRDLLLPRLIAGEIDVERMVEMERECVVVAD
jgi:type I restriction enzyme S subunit